MESIKNHPVRLVCQDCGSNYDVVVSDLPNGNVDIRFAKCKEAKLISNAPGGRIGSGVSANSIVQHIVPGKKLGTLNGQIITYDLIEDSYADALNMVPHEFIPDYMLFFLVETYCLPKYIERCKFPTIAIGGDAWKINKLFVDMKFFDAFVPGQGNLTRTYELLNTCKVLYVAAGGCQSAMPEEMLKKAINLNQERTYDVVATGNFDSPFYRNRSQYAWRLLQMSDKYNIFVGHVETLKECFDLIAKSKVALHSPSIQGGVVLRPFEIVSCGALLLHEYANGEIFEFFTGNESILTFNKKNFDDVVELAVEDDNFRNTLVKNATERNKEHTSIGNVKKLLDKIEGSNIKEDTDEQLNREALHMGDAEKYNWMGVSAWYARYYNVALNWFMKAVNIDSNLKYKSNLATCLLMLEIVEGSDVNRAAAVFEKIKESNSTISAFNMASFSLHVDDIENTIKMIETSDYEFMGDEIFFYLEYINDLRVKDKVNKELYDEVPDSFIFRMEMELALLEFPQRGEEYQKRIRNILIWRLHEYLGHHYLSMSNRNKAKESFLAAYELEPKNEYVLLKLANISLDEKDFGQAAFYFTGVLALSAFNEEAHIGLTIAQICMGMYKEAKKRLTTLLKFKGLRKEDEIKLLLEEVNDKKEEGSS